ncbi:Hypothetical protein ORPV_486 [Orpheovirus IHUMI-LCC2]|uniref:Uncharacterized protein n=1 Tax=Orpheovirus IHUMI-LCC2 TaxID=2023057 RepID=A0A2I2L4F9_9VIRU|nr:Hypothetical protein ORPV_486 [Orpheovirus IHUMI-LCC2]SNW62390.1 Hypothetical protein ORPV_486 [Orpheovirus IHUMI-LCC2]
MSHSDIMRTKMIPIRFIGDYRSNANDIICMSECIVEDFSAYVLEHDKDYYVDSVICNIEVPNFGNSSLVPCYYGLYIRICSLVKVNKKELDGFIMKYMEDRSGFDTSGIFCIDYVKRLGNSFTLVENIEDMSYNIKKIIDKNKIMTEDERERRLSKMKLLKKNKTEQRFDEYIKQLNSISTTYLYSPRNSVPCNNHE